MDESLIKQAILFATNQKAETTHHQINHHCHIPILPIQSQQDVSKGKVVLGGILRQDAEPSLYRYTQKFTVPGSKTTAERQGYIALGRLEDYSAGVVFRHEYTLTGPKADRMELLAEAPQPVDVPRDDGSTQRVYRCPSCQVAVFSEYTRPEIWFVRAGTLDDPASVAPDVHIFARSKVSWLSLPDDVPAFDVYYDSKEFWPAAEYARLRAALG